MYTHRNIIISLCVHIITRWVFRSVRIYSENGKRRHSPLSRDHAPLAHCSPGHADGNSCVFVILWVSPARETERERESERERERERERETFLLPGTYITLHPWEMCFLRHPWDTSHNKDVFSAIKLKLVSLATSWTRCVPHSWSHSNLHRSLSIPLFSCYNLHNFTTTKSVPYALASP